jgi:hypothetical protein
MQLAELIRTFSSEAYERHDKPGRIYLISDELTQSAKMKKAAAQYQAMLGGVDGGNLLDPKASTVVADLAEGVFGGLMGFSNARSAMYGLQASYQVQLTDGARRINFTVPPSPDEDMARGLGQAGLTRDTQAAPKRPAAGALVDIRALAPTEVQLLSFGPGSSDPALRFSDLAEGAAIISESIAGRKAHLEAIYHQLLARIDPSSGASHLERGLPVNRIPQRIKESIESELTHQFGRHGFADEASAQAFLTNARLTRSSGLLTLVGSRGESGGLPSYVVFALPPP